MAQDIDPDKIIDLGKSRDEEFGSPSSEENKVFFPTMGLDVGMIPGEVGSKMFLKVMVRKVSSDIEHDNERFEIQNMRVLGSADSDHKEAEADMNFDRAVEIVIEKKIKIQPEGQ